jgi:hypothetical protein
VILFWEILGAFGRDFLGTWLVRSWAKAARKAEQHWCPGWCGAGDYRLSWAASFAALRCRLSWALA